jgi:hypothetical protein
MLRTNSEGEHFLHRELWRVVQRQLRYADTNPHGAFYEELVAMVFALHTLEAYLNFAGERLAPEIWKDERDFFRKYPYRGFQGKLKKILELTGMPEPSPESRPFSTIEMLKSLRDAIAHAKPEHFSQSIDHKANERPDLLPTPLGARVTAANARMAKADTEAFIESIHSHASKQSDNFWFTGKALVGPLQYSSGTTSLAT